MTRQSRQIGVLLAAGVAIGAAVMIGVRRMPPAPAATPATLAGRGGDLVVSMRTEPASFNRLTRRDASTELVSILTQAKLVRVNRASQAVEPWLATSWTRSADGLHYTLALRPDVAFSDGQPFTADDVVFSFAAAYDDRTSSVLADSLQANGRKLTVAALDAHTVVVTFPEPFGPGVRILDNLPIFPRHKLQAALAAGTLARAWDLKTPPAEIAGLGPFVLSEYLPGQRLVFVRNPKYFLRDDRGTPLPYLDRITVEIIPDQNAEMLALEAGQTDMTTDAMRPEDYAPLHRAADAGRVRLLDLGVSYDADSLWFNLKPGAFAQDPRASWIQRDELRRAISMAVDRKRFADTVFLGAGVPVFGPETPANREWFSADVPQTPYDPAGARALVASIAGGQSPRFTLLTQKGRTSLERGSAIIRDELQKIGVVVDVVPLDGNALIQRFVSGAGYDAIYFRAAATDTDPALTPDFWFSFGSAHMWNIAEKTPATQWEREIDTLMAKQIASSDLQERKRLFVEVQRIFAEHQPAVYFAAPRVFVASSSRVVNNAPALIRPQLLWAPDRVAVAGAARPTH
ncbi:MAG TPA: ABC transporter substrate-binding protein [Vicinamibacterales bacterium]|nr:ABC transporter substrate-binding protein [Vicinamibacterales bacterium]